MQPLRAAIPAVAALLVVALPACGGDDEVGDRVPATLPGLTVPQSGVDASGDTPDTTDTTDTTDTEGDDEPTGAAPGGGAGAASGGAAVTPAAPEPSAPATSSPAPAPAPEQDAGGTSGGAAPAPQEDAPAADEPDVGGASPDGGQFREWCADNPGAC